MSYKIRSGTEVRPLDSQRKKGNHLIPKLPFSMTVVAGKGQGKSTLLLNLLLSKDFLAGKFNKIIYISPTVRMDKKVNDLKGTKGLTCVNKLLLKEYKKLRKSKPKIFDIDIGYEEENDTCNIDFFDTPDMKMIQELCDHQEEIITIFDSKEIADDILIVLDDTASSKVWKNLDFIKLIFNSRHYNISAIITTQAYHSISKPIRMNQTYLVLFETANFKELETIYSENKTRLNFKEFLEICKNVFDIPFNFLVLNYQNDRAHRVQTQFKSFIEY